MSRTFLHPSQRPLKTEQIGPSSHKNEYHVGVLHGNWAEERNAFGMRANGPVKFSGQPTTKATYPPRSAADIRAAQTAMASSAASEAPRALLFGHGAHQVHLVSTAETSYNTTAISPTAASTTSQPNSPTRTTTKLSSGPSAKLPVILPAVSTRRDLSERKRAEWDAEANSVYVTTKNATFDATADAIATADPALVYPKHSSSHHGEFLHSLSATMHKSRLRPDFR